jgi:hypothetical protein
MAPVNFSPSNGQGGQAPRSRKIAEAMAFLRAALATGARPAAEVEAEALAQGIKHATLQTARERLHISSKRRGNQWIWTPPRARKPRSLQAAKP